MSEELSFSEQLAKPKVLPTNEGTIDTESIPPMYPIAPPGWLSAEYTDDKTEKAKCWVGEDDEMGKYLVAQQDFEPGDCVLEDTALLQVPWDLDLYLHTPIHGLLVKMKAQYGEKAIEQGYGQLIARFLQAAKTETRESGSLLWDILNWKVTPLNKEDLANTTLVASAIHDCIPSSYEDILSIKDIVQIIRAHDTNSITCNVGKGHTAVYPFARLAEHHCKPNCTFLFLDHPDDAWASRVQYRALHHIQAGDRISISYISGYQPTAERKAVLKERYGFVCNCSACNEFDTARGFKCWLCDKNVGVISPIGEGLREEDWRCMQCGVMLETERIQDCLEAEKKLRVVKADKWKGLSQLMGDDVMHYTHYLCFRKLDQWSQKAWVNKDGEFAANMAEALLKCAERIFTKIDPVLAQYNEFLAQIHHGRGEAYTAQHHYQVAYKIRVAAGHGDTYWAKKTKYMAYDKPIGEFMDGK